MLHAERYADDGDTKEYPEEDVRQEYPHAPDEKPNDVHDDREATAALGNIDDFTTERP